MAPDHMPNRLPVMSGSEFVEAVRSAAPNCFDDIEPILEDLGGFRLADESEPDAFDGWHPDAPIVQPEGK